jgi:hypothetical protein
MVGTASNTPAPLLAAVSANTVGGGLNNGANPGTKVQRAVFTVQVDPTVTAGTIVINGSTDGSTYATALGTFVIAGSQGVYKSMLALFLGAGSNFVGFNAVLSGYAGSGNVTVTWADEEDFDGSGLF